MLMSGWIGWWYVTLLIDTPNLPTPNDTTSGGKACSVDIRGQEGALDESVGQGYPSATSRGRRVWDLGISVTPFLVFPRLAGGRWSGSG